MKTTLLTTRQIAKKLSKFISDFDEFYWAVAWGSDGPLADELLANKKKIRNILIGTDFYQTDPKLLERLAPISGSRVALNIGNGTFHPKVYYFGSDDYAAAIVGSANFTQAGTTVNIEAAFLLEGSSDEEPLRSIKRMIESLWSEGSPIDDDFLTSYTLQYTANQRHRKALRKPIRLRRPKKTASHPDLLTMSWRDFVAAVKSSIHHDLDIRLDVLSKARLLINRVNTFSELSLAERKAIAGVVGRNEEFGNDLDNYEWGWFGSMFGFGDLKNRIAENDIHLSLAFEHIPSTGEVTQDDYFRFIEEFLLAFENSERQGGVPSASRLLAMKRPDLFVCVDKKNLRKMSEDFGFSRTTLNFERYWTDIIEPITQANWWQVRRPSGLNGRIWDGRAAMLDAIYYEPT
jgi:HKD family nuclease